MSLSAEEHAAELEPICDVINSHCRGGDNDGAAEAQPSTDEVQSESDFDKYAIGIVFIVCFANANTQGFVEIAGIFNNREAADDCLLRQLNNYREDFGVGLEPTKRDCELYTHGRDYACLRYNIVWSAFRK